jgi:LacI family transcriptional regulator
MREVAGLAGVSISTVSRVVNGDRRVDRALTQRVHEATRMLGYRHNAAASALRRADGVTASIGLILEDVANPFFSAVHRGIEDVARGRGYLTFTGSSDEDPERERGLAAAFAARNVDGLIIAPSPDDHGYLADEQEHGIRLVFVDRPRASSTRTPSSATTARAPARPSSTSSRADTGGSGGSGIAWTSSPPPSAWRATATRSWPMA